MKFGSIAAVALIAIAIEIREAWPQELSPAQFDAALSECAAQKNITVPAGLASAIKKIYSDPVTRDALKSFPVFVTLVPDDDRVDAYKLHLQCLSQIISQGPAAPPSAGVTTALNVCSGEYEGSCQQHDVYLYCYSDVRAWANSHCGSYQVVRTNTYGGNKCGYSIDRVICTGPR